MQAATPQFGPPAGYFASVWAHDFDRAVEESRAAIVFAEPLAEKRVLARASLSLAMVYGVTGHLPQGKAELERAIILAPSVGDHFTEAMALALGGLFKNLRVSTRRALSVRRLSGRSTT